MILYIFKMMILNFLKVGLNLMAVLFKISFRMNLGCLYVRVDVCLEKKELFF